MRLGVAFLAASATALALAACLIDTSGLAGGPQNDGPDGATSSGNDAGAIAPLNEAGAPLEAGGDIDAGSSPFFVSSGNGGWCKGLSPQPRTCIDFDEASDLTIFHVVATNGTATLDNVATSMPNALYSQLTDPAQTGFAFVQLDYSQTAVSAVQAQADVRFETPNNYVEFETLQFTTPNGDSACAIGPTVNSGSVVINEYCTGKIGDLSVNTPVATLVPTVGWYTVLVTVDFTARTFSSIVKKPDGTTEGMPSPVTIDPKIQPGVSRLLAGMGYSQAVNPTTRIRVDNIVLNYR